MRLRLCISVLRLTPAAFVLLVGWPAAATSPRLARVEIRTTSGDVTVHGRKGQTTVTGAPRLQVSGATAEVRGDHVSDDVTVTVPDDVALSIKTLSGQVTVLGVRGDIRCRTTSGDIEIREAKRVDVQAISGSLDLAQIALELVARTVSGKIAASDVGQASTLKSVSGDIRGRGTLHGLTLSTVSGEVRLPAVLGPIAVHTTSGNVELGATLRAGERFTMQTHSGDLHAKVHVPQGVLYRLQSYSGRMDLRPGKRAQKTRNERRAEGRLGAGKATVELSSFSGDFDLELSE